MRRPGVIAGPYKCSANYKGLILVNSIVYTLQMKKQETLLKKLNR